MKDSEPKQAEANAIIAAYGRANIPWDRKVVTGYVHDLESLTPEARRDAARDALDAWENVWKKLHEAGEGEIADKYFSHPRQIVDLLGYLPK